MKLVEIDRRTPRDDGWILRRRERVLVPPERVWTALTEPRELRLWLCDAAEIDPRPGGRFRCTGPTVFGSAHPDESEPPDAARGEIVEIDAPRVLAVRWPVRGMETLVRFELETELEQTEVVVTQTAPAPPAWEGDDRGPNWWWISLSTLRSYLEDGAAELRLNYAEATRQPVLSFTVGATTFPWVVWRKLTEPAAIARWWRGNPRLELREGGVFRFDDAIEGPQQVLRVEEGRLFAHDWRWPGGAVSRIEWRIEESSEDTQLSVTDFGPWDAAADRERIAILWAGSLLHLLQISEKGATPKEYQHD